MAVGSLFPHIFNLAAKAIITSNATCGETGSESYCKLVEHVFMRSPQCDSCDDSSPTKRHPIDFAVDGSNRWWQSPTLAHGMRFEWITITIDLRQQYQVAYVIVKAAIAPRPGNWILERSLDGVTYKPWQFYATSDEECERVYGMKATVSQNSKFSTHDQVICTSYYSRLDPFIDGEIHTSLVNGRPGIDGPSLELQEFTKARFIRLRLQKIRTLNSDLIFITRRKQRVVIDESVTRRYFYAIRDISIGGQCICYGHAEFCPPDPATQQLRCECKHNTCGESCNECCPLFNQTPWRAGTNLLQHACEACQCFNHSSRCAYDDQVDKNHLSITPDGLYEGGGVCQQCQHSTAGINCQQCQDMYYRPTAVSHYSPNACRACDCNPTGSLDQVCIRDEAHVTGHLQPGDCRCRRGFGGRTCDRCATGFRNYPVCDPCPCNRAGSANFATCDNTCLCKANVEGSLCDRCKPGYFNLDENNADGCTKCFCFGLTDKCTELAWGSYKIRESAGWGLVDSDFTQVPYSVNGSALALTLSNKLVHGQVGYYWQAPGAYLGSKLTSYGALLSYFVYYVIDGRRGSPFSLPDVILKNKDVVIKYESRKSFNDRENCSMQIRMHESDNWYDQKSGQSVTKQQLMSVLSNVDLLAVRASYNQGQIQSSIYGFSMESAKADSTAQELVFSAEKCSCPLLYTGLSCQACNAGYRRVNNELHLGKCEACSCHEHSMTCDPYNSSCTDCNHNTTGTHCELCKAGYYGNPRRGAVEGVCKRCACPLLDDSNNFSPTCSLTTSTAAANSPSHYICTACAPGYMGDKCEWCTDGFFGQPEAPGNYCQPCQCNGNIDLAAIGNCDRKTGRCFKCISNTTGFSCEHCKPDYYGNALKHDCKACGCNRYGSVNSQCDLATGKCTCKQHYTGDKCDQCQDGYGGVENGCKPCHCDSVGAFSEACDQVSGQCQCKPGVFGKNCDTCQSGYFGFSDNGCDYCNCYPHGSEDDGKCDVITGKCFCRQHVKGNKCNVCQDGFFNISSGSGCKPCNCHPFASESQTCDLLTGKCDCKQAVTGLQCDKCVPNFYGLSGDGCKQCPVCPAPGHVCDPRSGQCVCPPYTVGDMCELCAANSWNHDAYNGCQACGCDSAGSLGATCDRHTGACKCRAGYTGTKCDQCTHGHFRFPSCLKCNCNAAGTNDHTCSVEGACSCDDNGQCFCKKNVVGQKCSECNATSFSLEAGNPKGCTECFCFNKTNFCVQSSLIWRQSTLEKRTAFFQRPWLHAEKRYGLNVMPAEPTTFNVEQYPVDSPLYWALPVQFLGDRITSYNGYLQFRITNMNGNYVEGASRPDDRFFERHPMVVLVGNHRIILEHFKSTKDTAQDGGVYTVKLTEDVWKNRHKSQKYVQRQSMMVALQNVQAIFIRATYIDGISEANLFDVTMDLAVAENSSISHSSTAMGVEACDCPRGYAGPSCQNPAEAYCRKKIDDYLDSADDLDLVGVAVQCSCHSHSNTCDRETCTCLECQHNTTGGFCQHCAAGFYGHAMQGTEHDCKQCACPSEQHSFSETCFATSHNALGYVCDKCRTGHEGGRCEKCQAGYFGDPVGLGEACQRCACNPYGSVSDACDPITGQCLCRPGVTGRDCSECRPRYSLVGSDCTSCDIGCTKQLMHQVDVLESLTGTFNFSGMVPAPWGHLARIQNRTTDFRHQVTTLLPATDPFSNQELSQKLAQAKKRLTDGQKVVEEAKYLWNGHERAANRSKDVLNAVQDIIFSTNRVWDTIHTNYAFLKRYTQTGTTPAVDAEKLVVEANTYIDVIKHNTEFIMQQLDLVQQADNEATNLLAKVKAKIFNDTVTNSLWQDVENLNNRLKDASKIVWEDVRRNVTGSESILKITGKMMIEFENIQKSIQQSCAENEQSLVLANKGLTQAKHSLLDIYDYFTECNETLFGQIQNATDVLDMRQNQLAQFLPEYTQNYFYTAEKHAKNLAQTAEKIEAIFAPTRVKAESPVNASLAYANIKHAALEARSKAEEAQKTIEAVHGKIYSDQTDLVKIAERSFNDSLLLKEKTKDMTTSDVKDDLHEHKLRLYESQKMSMEIRKNASKLDGVFAQFDAVNQKSQNVVEQCQQIYVIVDVQKGKSDELESQVAKLRNVTRNINAIPGSLASGLAVEVEQVAQKIADATERIRLLKDKVPTMNDKLAAYSSKLALLKEKIKEAREKASQVRISVISNGSEACYRSYASQMSPSPSNNLHIEYRPTDDVTDALIFITMTNQTRTRPSEFLALELRNQRFVFKWNVGGSEHQLKQVTNPQRVTAFPRLSHTLWYHVDIERRGNLANLTVGKPEEVKNESGTFVTFKYESQASQDDSTPPFLFNAAPGLTRASLGVAPGAQPPNGVHSAAFRGALGKAVVDAHEFPLWNFLENAGSCAPYHSSKKLERPPDRYMLADGYAHIQKMPGYNSRKSFVVVTFSTYSENGLLYFRGNNNTKDFLSIELEEGRVKTQINLGGMSKVKLFTDGSYNDGRKYGVIINRNEFNTSLIVKTEAGDIETKNVVIPGRFNSLESDTDHYIGGVPESFPKQAWKSYKIQWKGFYGCVVQPIIADTHNLQIKPSKALNMKPGCLTNHRGSLSTDRVASFNGEGSLIINGVQLTPKSSLSINFRTKQRNGLLFYQSASVTTRKRRHSPSESGYIIGYIEDCAFVLTIAYNSDDVAQVSSGFDVCDGLLHSAFIKRIDKKVELYMDDRFVESETLQQARTIGVTDWSQMFLGGLGKVRAPVHELPQYTPFTGCISDLFVDFKNITLTPQRIDKVTLGTCVDPTNDLLNSPQGDAAFHVHAPEIYDEPSLAADTDMMRDGFDKSESHEFSDDRINEDFLKVIEAPCAEPKPTTNAVLYGTSEQSYSTLYNSSSRNFDIALKFRTESSNGTIFAWTSYSLNQFLALTLLNGQMRLVFRFHKMAKPKSLLSNQANEMLNDNRWHWARLRKKEKILRLTVDSFADVKYSRASNHIALKKMTVGGAKRSAALKMAIPPKFTGCIKNVEINHVKVDLTRQAATGTVGNCFEQPAETVSFAGNGSYLQLHAPAIRNLSFQFRPWLHVPSTLQTVLAAKCADGLRSLVGLSSNQSDASQFTLAFGFTEHTIRHKCAYTWHKLDLVAMEHGVFAVLLNQKLLGTTVVVDSPQNIKNFVFGSQLGNSFVGCLRKVKIDGRNADLDKEIANNVKMNECH